MPTYLPFRSITQDLSYAFLRGINSSAVFFQDPLKSAGNGACLTPTATHSVVVTACVAGNIAQNQWGFKEHPFKIGHFYIYSRNADRAISTKLWLKASSDCSSSELSLTEWYGDDTLWQLIPGHHTEKNTPQTTVMEEPWSGNPYSWNGVYALRNAARNTGLLGPSCAKTDLAVT